MQYNHQWLLELPHRTWTKQKTYLFRIFFLCDLLYIKFSVAIIMIWKRQLWKFGKNIIESDISENVLFLSLPFFCIIFLCGSIIVKRNRACEKQNVTTVLCTTSLFYSLWAMYFYLSDCISFHSFFFSKLHTERSLVRLMIFITDTIFIFL